MGKRVEEFRKKFKEYLSDTNFQKIRLEWQVAILFQSRENLTSVQMESYHFDRTTIEKYLLQILVEEEEETKTEKLDFTCIKIEETASIICIREIEGNTGCYLMFRTPLTDEKEEHLKNSDRRGRVEIDKEGNKIWVNELSLSRGAVKGLANLLIHFMEANIDKFSKEEDEKQD